MTYDLTIDLPTEQIENLFLDCDDDHMAIPSAASPYKRKSHREKFHDEMLDTIVEKMPATQNIKNWVCGMQTSSNDRRHEKIVQRRAKYAHRDDPRCINDTFIQRFIDA